MHNSKLTKAFSIIFISLLANNASISGEPTFVDNTTETAQKQSDWRNSLPEGASVYGNTVHVPCKKPQFSVWECKTKPAPEPEIPVHLLVKEEETPLWQQIFDSITSCFQHRS